MKLDQPADTTRRNESTPPKAAGRPAWVHQFLPLSTNGGANGNPGRNPAAKYSNVDGQKLSLAVSKLSPSLANCLLSLLFRRPNFCGFNYYRVEFGSVERQADESPGTSFVDWRRFLCKSLQTNTCA